MTSDGTPISIDQETYEAYFTDAGMPFDEVGLNVKHGTTFGAQGREASIRDLERALEFRFPTAYLETLAAEDPNLAAAHFRSGWWRVLDDDAVMVLWGFSLSLQSEPPPEDAEEDTLAIADRLRQAGCDAVPFGDGFRIDKQSLTSISGWLCFARDDGAPVFVDAGTAKTTPLAPDFAQLMTQARFVGFDA